MLNNVPHNINRNTKTGQTRYTGLPCFFIPKILQAFANNLNYDIIV